MPIYKKKDPVVKEIHGRWEWGTEILDHTGWKLFANYTNGALHFELHSIDRKKVVEESFAFCWYKHYSLFLKKTTLLDNYAFYIGWRKGNEIEDARQLHQPKAAEEESLSCALLPACHGTEASRTSSCQYVMVLFGLKELMFRSLSLVAV
jgi:hypothetical protein